MTTHKSATRALKAAMQARVGAAAVASAFVVGCSLPGSLPGLGAGRDAATAPTRQTADAPGANAASLRTTRAAASDAAPVTTTEPSSDSAALVATAATAAAARDEDAGAAPEPLGGSAADDFKAALSLAYATNPTLQAQRAAVNSALQNVTIARSERFPQLSATAGYDVSETTTDDSGDGFGPTADGGFGPVPQDELTLDSSSSTFSYGLTASQAVYQGGRVRAGIDAARADVEASRAQLSNTAQTVLVEAITAYVNARRDQEVVTIRLNNVEVLSRQLRAARDRLEFGEGTVTDVAQAEARLAGARTELAAAQSDLAATRANYERVIGQAPGTLAPPPGLPALPQSLEAAEADAFNNNPQVVAARFAEASAKADVRSARSAFRPSVDLQGGYRRNRNGGDREQVIGEDVNGNPITATFDIDNRSETVSGGVTASIPLFTGGANGARVRQARASESQARLQVREAERLAREAVVSAWNALIAARAQIDSSEEQVRANEVALQGVRDEAEFGQRTTLDVLDAEQELLDSRLALVSAESDAYVAAFQLLQAAGGLDARALGLSTTP